MWVSGSQGSRWTSQSNEKIDGTHLHQPQDHARTVGVRKDLCFSGPVMLLLANSRVGMVVVWWLKSWTKRYQQKKGNIMHKPTTHPGSFCERMCSKHPPLLTQVGLLRKVGTSVDTQQEGDELIKFSGFQRGLISCGVFGFLLLRHAPKGSCLWWSSRLVDVLVIPLC